jgi:hypothetical protein
MERSLEVLARVQQEKVAAVTEAIGQANAATRERLVAEAHHLLPEGARSLRLDLEIDEGMTWFYASEFVDADGETIPLIDPQGTFDEVIEPLDNIAGDLWLEGSDYGMNWVTAITLDLTQEGDA